MPNQVGASRSSRVRRTLGGWGRSRLGGRDLPALAVAIPAGLVLALAFALVSAYLSPADVSPALLVLVHLACSAPLAVGLVWVLVVDRTTVPGAVASPEDGVESRWYDKSVSHAFHATLATAGVVTFLGGAFLPAEVRWTLTAVVVFMMLAAAVGYLVERSR